MKRFTPRRAYRTVFAHLLLTAVATLLSFDRVRAQGTQFVPNVLEQFNALTERPDPIGFDTGVTPDPSLCKHYEAITRLQGPDGTPYFVLTRSGLQVFPCVTDDDDPGNLVIVRMGSREKHGERMRSNRLRKGYDLADTPSDPHCSDSNCVLDLGVKYYRKRPVSPILSGAGL